MQTIAFNLPNDERVREAKGSKKVLLRNLMRAKYEQILVPIGKAVPSRPSGMICRIICFKSWSLRQANPYTYFTPIWRRLLRCGQVILFRPARRWARSARAAMPAWPTCTWKPASGRLARCFPGWPTIPLRPANLSVKITFFGA